jgi:mannan endo-1,4-beta-mannosidase
MWAAFDIGNQDGSNSVSGKADGSVYFQYWNGVAPAYNDGADGLAHLDYVVKRAGDLGIKLVIPLVNNWADFGGMDQYVRWRGGQYHDDFYRDPAIRQWFKNWISHLLNHKNALTGVRLKDDPAIMTWELANEPRCQGSGVYPTSASCNTTTLTTWADEMSRAIKRIDKNHLVSAGDEGFYCSDPSSFDWTENCGSGVDTIALASLPAMDVMSYHLYPDGWGKDVAWGTSWIERHIADGMSIDKPAMLGEFGLSGKSMRNANYKTWTDSVMDLGGAGALYWMLAGKQDDNTLYPDYDGFTVYCPSPVCSAISHFGAMMSADRSLPFAPVADNDATIVEFASVATLHPLLNDLSYDAPGDCHRCDDDGHDGHDRDDHGRKHRHCALQASSLVASSIDLDPASAGQQASLSVAAGTFVPNPAGSVSFTPAAGFLGAVSPSYVVLDSAGRASNTATLSVTVKPNPNAAQLIHGFETSTEGWGPASWDPGAGSAALSSAFHTQGNSSLAISANYGEWFGLTYGTPLNISGKTHLKWDVSAQVSTSQELAIQAGSGWTWCQAGGWPWLNAGTSTSIDVDLSTLDCGAADLSEIHGLYIYLGNGGAGTIYLDNVRAE